MMPVYFDAAADAAAGEARGRMMHDPPATP